VQAPAGISLVQQRAGYVRLLGRAEARGYSKNPLLSPLALSIGDRCTQYMQEWQLSRTQQGLQKATDVSLALFLEACGMRPALVGYEAAAATRLTELELAFRKADADGNGSISRQEQEQLYLDSGLDMLDPRVAEMMDAQVQ
jgi:hypothetical protein